MDLGINGKTALVTGAGRGLGEGICLSLNKEGVRIIALSRSKEPLVVLSNKLVQCDSGANELITADLSKSDETDSVISELLNKKIQPDIIVNNAGGGIGSRDPLKTFESWEKVAKLNLECAIKINEAFIPQMQKNSGVVFVIFRLSQPSKTKGLLPTAPQKQLLMLTLEVLPVM